MSIKRKERRNVGERKIEKEYNALEILFSFLYPFLIHFIPFPFAGHNLHLLLSLVHRPFAIYSNSFPFLMHLLRPMNKTTVGLVWITLVFS